MIDEKEFYRRFDSVVPGEDIADKVIHNIQADIYFERLSMDGLAEMHRYSTDNRLYEFFEFKAFVKLEDTKTYLEKLLNRMAGDIKARSAMYWFVRRTSDHYLIGTACLVGLNYNRKSVEWGYGIDPALWGTGYILQIQEMLKHYVFEILQLNRLEGITMVENKRTISSVLAAGMKHEGTIRQFYCKDGVFSDGWKYAMIRQEYFEKINQGFGNSATLTNNDVISIISSVLDEENINIESTMFNTANWDSLNHMSIMVALFEKTKISLSPIQISNATSIRSIAQLINGKSNLK